MTVDGRVGRLALRAGSRAAVDDFARQIETALALARWPYARPGEVILIRRLALDDLPQGASVHLLADLIGRRLVEIRPVRLRAGDPERPGAPLTSRPSPFAQGALPVGHLAALHKPPIDDLKKPSPRRRGNALLTGSD